MYVTHVFLHAFQHQGFEVIEAPVDSLSPLLFHQWLVALPGRKRESQR